MYIAAKSNKKLNKAIFVDYTCTEEFQICENTTESLMLD